MPVLSKRDRLADYAHQAWSGWMLYLFKKCTLNDDGSMTIPKSLVERWKRQCTTKFAELPKNEQESDYKEADDILEIVEVSS